MQKCKICISPKKTEIEEALLLSSKSLRDISGQFRISKSALQRHKEDHIPTDLVQAKEATEICKAEELLNKLINLKSDAARITNKAETNNDLKTALSGIREQSRIIEILAKMENLIQQPQVSLTVNNLCLSKIYNRLGRKMEAIIEVNE
jgi:hypothetical protein